MCRARLPMSSARATERRRGTRCPPPLNTCRRRHSEATAPHAAVHGSGAADVRDDLGIMRICFTAACLFVLFAFCRGIRSGRR